MDAWFVVVKEELNPIFHQLLCSRRFDDNYQPCLPMWKSVKKFIVFWQCQLVSYLLACYVATRYIARTSKGNVIFTFLHRLNDLLDTLRQLAKLSFVFRKHASTVKVAQRVPILHLPKYLVYEIRFPRPIGISIIGRVFFKSISPHVIQIIFWIYFPAFNQSHGLKMLYLFCPSFMRQWHFMPIVQSGKWYELRYWIHFL